jgi:hypothetical protein
MEFQIGKTFNSYKQTATNAVIKKTGVDGKSVFITDIQGYTDTAGASLLITNETSTVVLFEHKTPHTGPFSYSFNTPLRTPVAGQSLTATLGSASVGLGLTICGYYL